MKKLLQICLFAGMFFIGLVDYTLANQSTCAGKTYCLGIDKIFLRGEVKFDEAIETYTVNSDFDISVLGICRKWMGTARKVYMTVSISNQAKTVQERTCKLDSMKTGTNQERTFHFEDIPSGEYTVKILIRNRGYFAKAEKFFKIKKGM